MSYVDTSVIVVALDPKDSRREHARSFLESDEYKVVSELVLVELASALSRRNELLLSLASKLGVSNELLVTASLLYILRRFKLKYRAITVRTRPLPFGRIYAPVAVATELSSTLRLKTLNLLHVAYVKILKEEGEPIRTLVTADSDFKRIKKELRDSIGVEVLLLE